MQYKISLLVCYIFAFYLTAQKTTYTEVYGKVVDEKKVPLADVVVQDVQSKTISITNLQGVFQMRLPRGSKQLVYKKLAYKIQQNDYNFTNDTSYVLTLLSKKIKQLPAVEINSEKIQLAYRRPSSYIIDYEWLEEGILLILEENKKYKLRWIDENEQTILETLIPAAPEKLHKDCFNNISVLFKDSTFQIHVNYDQLKLLAPIARPKYDQIVIPCITSMKQNYYFQNFSNLNKAITYLAVDTFTKKQTVLQNLFNSESYNFTYNYYNRILANLGNKIIGMADVNWSDLVIQRNPENDLLFYEMILLKPIYGPLFKIRDSIFVFDHTNDTSYVFNDSSQLVRKFPIIYQHQKGWAKELFIDAITQNIYAKFIKDGLTYLYAVNASNGRIDKIHKLEKHVFLNNIKIKEGYAYYLYKDKIDYSFNYLYRQRLE